MLMCRDTTDFGGGGIGTGGDCHPRRTLDDGMRGQGGSRINM